MSTVLRYLFFIFIVKPLVLIGLGLNVHNRQRLPSKGPAIIVANHNSHLDTLVLITLFPLKLLKNIRPVGAADYFLRNRFLSWFALKIIGIIPIYREVCPGTKRNPLTHISAALERGDILIFYPEGTRGQPEKLQSFKTGIAHIAKRHPQVPIIPVFIHGLGKVLPKGEALLVPFICDVVVGEHIRWEGSKEAFMNKLSSTMKELAFKISFPAWE
jgi:1-acyl-sn-glycerol-3-phosphate acyltransferase